VVVSIKHHHRDATDHDNMSINDTSPIHHTELDARFSDPIIADKEVERRAVS
jgi:hypothetical protein